MTHFFTVWYIIITEYILQIMKIIRTLLLAGVLLVALALVMGPVDEDAGVEAEVNYPQDGIYKSSTSDMVLDGGDLSGWTTYSRTPTGTEPNWTESHKNDFEKTYQPGHIARIYSQLMKFDTVDNATEAYDNITSTYYGYANAKSIGVGNSSIAFEQFIYFGYQYFIFFQTGNVVMELKGQTIGVDAMMDMDEDDFINIANDQFNKVAGSVEG